MNYQDVCWILSDSGQALTVIFQVGKEHCWALAVLDQANIQQLWRFIPKAEGFKIIHVQTGCCLVQQNSYFRLISYNQANLHCLFHAIPHAMHYHTFTLYQSSCMVFDNGLRLVLTEPKHALWRIRVASEAEVLKKSVVIQSLFSGRVMTVAKGSMQRETPIIQSPFNRKINQRWVVWIKSLSSQMCLQPKRGLVEMGIVLVQDQFKGEVHQLWRMKEIGYNLYSISNLSDEELGMGVKNKSLKDDMELNLCGEPMKNIWKVYSYSVSQLKEKHK